MKIIAVNLNGSDSQSAFFDTHDIELMVSKITSWEKTLPYSRYELMVDGVVEDYQSELKKALNELEITY
jgi:hypothetical protein